MIIGNFIKTIVNSHNPTAVIKLCSHNTVSIVVVRLVDETLNPQDWSFEVASYVIEKNIDIFEQLHKQL